MTLHPSLVLVLGAVLSFVLPKGGLRNVLLLLTPLFTGLSLWNLGDMEIRAPLADLGTLALIKVTPWNLPFAWLFCLMLFLGLLYSRAVDSRLEDGSAILYAAAAVGAVLSGDLFTLYCFWELLALFSTAVVFAGDRPGSKGAAFRYLLVHIAGGLLLLLGILWRLAMGFDLSFTVLALNSPANVLIFLGLGVNGAWPLLHGWVVEAYPETSPSGVLYLSSFTTKTAVYALAVLYPGERALVAVGAVMVLFTVWYAVIENDLRKVLSYSLINQVGFMTVGIGIGTDLALAGAFCHAMTDVVFKGLLFMTMGACLYRTGTSEATGLGGLAKSMPVTACCCLVGTASIAAVPGFSGFVSKAMITTAAGAAEQTFTLAWFALLVASSGVMEHLKVPYLAFFSREPEREVEEAPKSMQAAMVLAAAMCLVVGLFPQHTVYALMPIAVLYEPYTLEHVVTQSQLLIFATLAISLLLTAGLYPKERKGRNRDVDLFFERGGSTFSRIIETGLNGLNALGAAIFYRTLPSRTASLFEHAPARILIGLEQQWLKLRDVPPEAVRQVTSERFAHYREGAQAMGASALFAVVVLAVLVWV